MRHLLTLAVLSAAASAASAAPVACILNTNTTIDMVNVPTNAETPAGTVPFVGGTSLARTPAGSLIAADTFGNLWDVTGAPIPVGPTGRTQIADLDYGVGGLWGYSNASQELFFFNLGSLSVTYSQSIAAPVGSTVTGVAYQPSTGDVYLSAYSALNTDVLLKVPSMATSATLIGAMNNGDAFSYFSDIDFAPSGNLIAVSFYHRWFYDVNTSTAATTLISAGPHRDTTAMALDAVPEPTGLATLAAGAGITGLLRRRRTAR